MVSAHPSGRKGTEEAERRGGVEHRARDMQELPSGDPKEEPFQGDQCPLEGKSLFPDLTRAPSIWPKPALAHLDKLTPDLWTAHAP